MRPRGRCQKRKVVQVRIANIEWSSVYFLRSNSQPGTDEGKVVVYADVAGAQASAPAAVLVDAKEVAAARHAAEEDPRFKQVGAFWIDRARLRHTRSG